MIHKPIDETRPVEISLMGLFIMCSSLQQEKEKYAFSSLTVVQMNYVLKSCIVEVQMRSGLTSDNQ